MTRSNVLSIRPGGGRERLIAALVPNAVQRAESVPAAPVPLLPALALVQHAGPAALLVATARIDGSGRVCERLVLRALGWQPGQRLAMDAVHGLIVIAAVPDGPYVVDGRGAVGLPAPLRRLCGIKPGPPVVLAAVVAEQVLLVHPPVILARLLGRLGLIVSPKKPNHAAHLKRNSVFSEDGKVILFLTVEHLIEMLYTKERGEDPADLIMDAVERFYIEWE